MNLFQTVGLPTYLSVYIKSRSTSDHPVLKAGKKTNMRGAFWGKWAQIWQFSVLINSPHDMRVAPCYIQDRHALFFLPLTISVTILKLKGNYNKNKRISSGRVADLTSWLHKKLLNQRPSIIKGQKKTCVLPFEGNGPGYDKSPYWSIAPIACVSPLVTSGSSESYPFFRNYLHKRSYKL